MILESVCVGPFQVNCYILACEENTEAIIIDPGDQEKKIRQALSRHKLKPAFIINTHAHFDHIGCDDKFGVPVYIHEDDLALLKDPQLNLSNWLDSSYASRSLIKTLKDHEKIELGKMQLEVIHTPGHTPGGICLLLIKPVSKILFSGDTLFRFGVGRTDFPLANEGLLMKSIKDRLFALSDDTTVYPGHGPSTTIAEEKKSNPFLT
ncbi:MAG: MBL fold metallo-hydrolase [Candidatus Omnitrophica bacterium]|nr:MBL fold metallo-hydrolase [Candidatus Omnitrophota bacterium]